ncbi:MAG: hypothetical protein JW902_04650 [Syntrophaceae bacterium]|nr:hypothetical protein [Syntrophaceae bacterium]
MIPVEDLLYCHCNIMLALFRRNSIDRCLECGGTTWRFTEDAGQAGYRRKTVADLPLDEIKALPCNYFERCPCGYDEQPLSDRGKKELFSAILSLLDFKIPIPHPAFQMSVLP